MYWLILFVRETTAFIYYLGIYAKSCFTGKKAIILIDEFGQMGNSLIRFTHFIQFSHRNNFILYTPEFRKYAKYFSGFSRIRVPGYPVKKSFLSIRTFGTVKLGLFLKLLKRLPGLHHEENVFFEYSDSTNRIDQIHLYKNRVVYLDSPAFIEKIKNKRIILISGWRFRMKSFDTSPEFKKFIKNYFSPTHELKKIGDSSINTLKRDAECIVGVHFRRKDYRLWLNGKFFYGNEEMIRKIRELDKELRAHGKTSICYVLFSDEKIHLDIPELNIKLGPGNLAEDLYLLSNCNYIIGPPSTFSGWAAYTGEVPIYFMQKKEDAIQLCNFKKIEVWNGIEITLVNNTPFIL